MRGRGGSGLGARPVFEQRGHVFRLAPATTDIDKRADNRSHHMAEEAVSGDFIRKNAVAVTPYRSCNRARGPARVAARALKRAKIVRADEGRCRAFHCAQIERLRKIPDVGAVEWVRHRRIPDSVLVSLRTCAEPGVEARVHLGNREHPHVRRELRVERALQCAHVVTKMDNDTRHLTDGMNACIRAAGAMHSDARALESGERLLEQALNGVPFGLPLPTDKARSVVRERELEGSLCHDVGGDAAASDARARLDHGLTSRAKRARLGMVRRHRNSGQGIEGNVQILLSPAAVDDRCGPNDSRPCGLGDLGRLAGRHASGDHVFHDENALPGLQRKASPKHESPILTLSKNRSYTQGSPDFLSDDNTPQGRRQHDLRAQVPNPVRDPGATGLRFGGMLQDKGALQVPWTVQSRGQSEMTFEQGTHAAEPVEN